MWQFQFILLLLTVFGGSSEVNLFPSNELYALYDLYNSTNGENWMWCCGKKGVRWNFTKPNPNPCYEHWEGITCTSDCTIMSKPCHVNTMDLSGYNLLGTISQSIGNLNYLTELDFGGGNFLNGTIPLSFCNLTKLHKTYLNSNQLSGSIPECFYTNLIAMVLLDVHFNLLTGTISPSIGLLTSLSIVYLTDNRFHGPIPVSVCNLVQLTELDFGSNQLTSTLPNCIGNLLKLNDLSLYYNNLHGTIPESFLYLTQLNGLYLLNNEFTGTIPSSLQALTNLYYLFLDNNNFHGTFPSKLTSNMKTLMSVSLSNNLFTGSLPRDFLVCKYLTEVDFSYNSFQGNIPNEYNQLEVIETIFLNNNALTGSLPSVFNQLATLRYLECSNNFLSGQLPHSFAITNSTINKPNIDLLYLANNLFTGNLNVLQNWHNLTSLNVSNNLFSGCFCEVQDNDGEAIQFRLHLLSIIDISLNAFTGQYVKNLLAFSKNLLQINIARNQLSGKLDDIVSSRQLFALDVSGNQFTGTIPSFFFASPNLTSFSALKNCLTGALPVEAICSRYSLQTLALDGLYTANKCQRPFFPSISFRDAYQLNYDLPGGIASLSCLFGMDSLETLHLSGNAITGSLSSNLFLSDRLSDVSLSYNQLTGSIPSTFQTKKTWKKLDLSFNKFSGVLEEDFATPENTTSLTFIVNRLSGSIPSSLVHAEQIEMLQGNIFQCDSYEDLPNNDEYASNYDCGSNEVNTAVYVWISVVFGLCGLLGTYFVYLKQSNNAAAVWECCNAKFKVLRIFLEQMKEWYGVFSNERWNETTGSQNEILQTFGANMISFHGTLQWIRSIVVYVVVFSLFILSPTYCVLSYFYSSHAYVYIWNVSIGYLTGLVPAVIIMVLMGCLYIGFLSDISTFLLPVMKNGAVVKHPLLLLQWKACVKNVIDLLSYCSVNRTFWYSMFLHSMLLFIDMVIVLGVNICYVYMLTLNISTVRMFFIVIAFSLFKIVWGNVIVTGLFSKYLHAHYSRAFTQQQSQSSPPDDNISVQQLSNQIIAKKVAEEDDYHIHIVNFLSYLLIFNNILAPFVADALVDPNCFYYVIQAASPVVVSYQQYFCTSLEYVYSYDPSTTSIVCGEYSTVSVTTSYDPPFIYSFQCTSSLLNGFIVVFIYRYLISGVFVPLGKVILLYLQITYQILHHFTRIQKNVLTVVLLGDATDLPQESIVSRISYTWDVELTTVTKEKLQNQNQSLNESIDNKKRNERKEGEIISTEENNVNVSLYFNKEMFVVKLIGDIAVLMTFGLAFPPLAFIIGFAIVIKIFVQQVWLGYLIDSLIKLQLPQKRHPAATTAETAAEENNTVMTSFNPVSSYSNNGGEERVEEGTEKEKEEVVMNNNTNLVHNQQYYIIGNALREIQEECKDVLILFYPSIPVLALLSSTFIGAFLFEMLSDEQGRMIPSIWIFVLTASLPLCIWICEYCIGYIMKSYYVV